jgi:ribosome biogenesis GTPase / thiamine phosphate phosphatase
LKAAEGKIGRVYIIRLEDGDVIPTCLEEFAKENKIAVGLVTLIGGIGSGEIVTGPYSSDERRAGKSTLVNRLYGKTLQLTNPISTHLGKGKHTTTSRNLIMMSQGGMIIDNPGLREIAFWEVDKGIKAAFPEIKKLALRCRFTNCSHTHEPGCRVIGAVNEGEISRNRLENYLKMKRELEYLSHRRHKSKKQLDIKRFSPR